jgi:hypothetical protein
VTPAKRSLTDAAAGSGPLDHSVFPDVARPPDDLITPEDKADYLQRVCAAFDFGIFPERADWQRFAEWKPVFDAFPLIDSPAYHVFRARYGWDAVPRGRCGLEPIWRIQDRREGRGDPCEDFV